MARYPMRSLLALTVLLTLAAIVTPGRQQPGPGEVGLSSTSYRPPALYRLKVDTKLVEVAVVVRDPGGHAVAGLAKDDFEIADEGRKRQIGAFSVETSAPLATPAPSQGEAPPVVPSTPAAASQRYVALLFDDMSMGLAELAAAQAAALRFVKEGLRQEIGRAHV